MTYTFTHEDTARVCTFPSQEAFDDATVWAVGATKEQMVKFYAEWDMNRCGGPVGEIWADADCTRLTDDWQEIIMEAWASTRVAA